MGLKKYKVTFHNIFDAESEEDCFAQIIQGMWDVVYHDDTTAFKIEEVNLAPDQILNHIDWKNRLARWKDPDVTA